MISKRRRWLLIAAATAALIAPISYALSFGLVMWLYTTDWIGVSTFHRLGETIYRPLMWYIDNGHPGSEFLQQWYSDIRAAAQQDRFDPNL